MEKAEIQNKIVSVLNDMTQDWELELANGIGSETGLMRDLEFESIDVVQLAVSLEQSFEKKGLPFEQLFMRDGDYVDEIYVREVVDFMQGNMA
jgi:acyl carrier protein